MTIWFTSDTHYGHANIMKYSNRPFSSVKEMDESMIARWNSRVAPGDTVYHLGDFAFAKRRETVEAILQRLQGNKFLILGNHDKDSVRKAQGFVQITPHKEIKVGDQKIVLNHYAMKVWNRSHHGAWQLYGHSHGTLPNDPGKMHFDVGVDCWNYCPISFEQVAEEMKNHTFVPVDHHGASR